MSVHTPGPWSHSRGFDCRDGDERDAFIAMHPDWFEVSSQFDRSYNRMSVSGHIGEANARLIAAAPELLEALRKIDERLVHGTDHAKTSLDRKRAMDDAVTFARAAIAKATGAAP